MKNYKNIILLGLVGAVGLGALVMGTKDSQAAKEISDEERAAIETIIKEYLMENPNVILESVQAAQAREQEQREQRAQDQIAKFEDYFKDPSLPSLGRPSADVTIVEFFDYNCGYCKRALPDVEKIHAKDDNVRFVFMEMPILSQSSRAAAQWALAAHNQGKYFEYHAALMNHRGAKNENELTKMAEKIGLDIDRMKSDVASKELNDTLNKSIDVGRKIGISGTPAFIINNTLFPGYIGQGAMEKAIREAREG